MAAFEDPCILIVEDEHAQMELLAYNVEAEGFRVLRATDGEEAMLIAQEDQPDLIILDWMLPNLSGIEACRQLKRKPETKNIPIVMLTARGQEEDRVRGLDTGADDYVVKPYSVNELMARIRAIIRRTRVGGTGDTAHTDQGQRPFGFLSKGPQDGRRSLKERPSRKSAFFIGMRTGKPLSR